MASAAAAIILRPARQTLPVTMMSFTRNLNATVTSCSYSSSSASKRQLILYSKPGCCLCDGLKEKLHSAFSLSSPSPDSYSLHDVQLQIRDITSNPEWERAYQYEIPVLARLRSDGTEVPTGIPRLPALGNVVPKNHPYLSAMDQEVLPRFSPRAGVDHIQTKLAAALSRDD